MMPYADGVSSFGFWGVLRYNADCYRYVYLGLKRWNVGQFKAFPFPFKLLYVIHVKPPISVIL